MRLHKIFLSATILFALAAAALAQTGRSIKVDMKDTRLANGLRVITVEDHNAPVIAVNVTYNVGSRNERAGRTGFAHLFEHMMFQGSENVGKSEHFILVYNNGGTMNGSTNEDRTNYFEALPSNQIALALFLEADRMRSLAVTQDNLDNQRNAVQEERRIGLDNAAYGKSGEIQQELMYDNFAYKHSTIGSMTDLNAASVADVQAFFKMYYAPNNAVLVVAGDIDVPQAKLLVRRHFGSIPRGPQVPALASMRLPAIVGHEQRYVLVDSQIPAPAIYIGYRAPSVKDSRAPIVSLLGDVMGGGRSSRLYDALVRREQLATNVSGFNFGLADGADMLVFTATGKPGSNPDSLERSIMAELAGASSFTQGELDRARASERFAFVNGLQTTGGFGGRADRLAEGWTYFHDPNYVNTVLRDYDRVTLSDLNALAHERLVPTNRVVLIYVPPKKPASPPTTRVP